jgi:Zn-dependent peptidase ImmA (M78 family)/transcriptional regulator with XRE-family HTH domain
MTNGSESKEGIIIGAQLQRARELLQLTPEEVAIEITANLQDIIDWEKERSKPHLNQLEVLAKLYGREIDYFLRKTPAPPDKIEFRGKPGESLRNLSKEAKIALARFDELCRTAFEFESLLGKRREVKLSRFKESDSPVLVAQSLRGKFDAGNKPLPDLRNHLEEEGVRIFELPVPEDSFSGFSFWHEEYGPCIMLDAGEVKGRRNFTLAHEVAHLVYNDGSSICFISSKYDESVRDIEYKANRVAVELLLPEPGVRGDYEKRNLSRAPSVRDLASMASKWGASLQALGYRLENLGLIEKGFTDKIVEPKPEHFRRPKTPSWERQLGKTFVETSIEAYQKGLISSGKLAHALKIPIRKALERVEQKGK